EGGKKDKGGGGGTTVNVNVQAAALNATVRSAIQSALSDFSALKIDMPTGDIDVRQAAVIKNQFDSIREAIEKSGKTVDKKITSMFDEMDRLGHQSREFSNYFKQNYKKEDWDKLKKQFE
ncbi:MAG: hypothetical protein Q7S48_04905, partial [bacterium]|nr:hypothetical protein [bacterium]